MLRLASLTALGILCLTQASPLRLRTISGRKTAPVERDEHSTSDHASSLPRHFSSLLHSRSDIHDNETKLRLRLNSKFSLSEVIDPDETKTNAVANNGKRREKQEEQDERRYRGWTSQTTARRRAMRRVSEALHIRTPLYSPQRQRPNRVGKTAKKQRTLLSRAPKRNKPSDARHNPRMDTQVIKTSQSSDIDAKQSKPGSRRRRTAAYDDNWEDFRSNEMHEREQLSLPRFRSTEEEDEADFVYDDAFGEEDERKDEREEEELVQKRQSDEVMISRAVLDAMSERIYSRLKDFIDKNTRKKEVPGAEIKAAENNTAPVTQIKEAEKTTTPVFGIKETAPSTVASTTASTGQTPLPLPSAHHMPTALP